MIVQLKHHRDPCVSPDFISDVLTQSRNPNPTVREASLKLVGGHPSFVALMTRIVEKGFEGGKPHQRNSTHIFNLALMDGGHVCFSVRLNSSLSLNVSLLRSQSVLVLL